jgi:hypothetical protein
VSVGLFFDDYPFASDREGDRQLQIKGIHCLLRVRILPDQIALT